jgi:hypothetical protein
VIDELVGAKRLYHPKSIESEREKKMKEWTEELQNSRCLPLK